MRSALQRHLVDIHQPKVDLVDQSRRLKCVPCRFAPEMASRHAAQPVVHERDQTIQRRGISLAPGHEQAGYIVRAQPVGHRIVRENRLLLRFLFYKAVSNPYG